MKCRALGFAVVFVVRAAVAAGLDASFDERGLKATRFDGVDFLQDGPLRLVEATMEKLEGTSVKIGPEETSLAFDAAAHVATLTSADFRISCAYEMAADRITFAIEVANTSHSILRGFCLQLCELTFPSAPRGWRPFFPILSHNLGWPAVNVADFGGETIAVCNEDFGRPLISGFPGRLSLATRPVWIATQNIGWLSPFLDPLINRPIFPGGADHFRVSLRFAAGSVTEAKIAGDLHRRFVETYPPTLSWSDRRPIGALFLSRHESISPTNPRGWFDDAKADCASAEGRAKFQQALLRYAEESVRVLKRTNAQGMITWDPEGQEFTHPVSFLGDPRSLPPDISPVIDRFFKTFADAGLRTGLCLRPQRPVRPAYGGEAFQIDVAEVEKNLRDKIEFAQKRWGCTLFYVDSNGDPNVPSDALIFRRLAVAHPDILLMPEHKNALYHASTAPFYSFFHHGVTSTPDAVRTLYPKAFSVLYAPEGPLDEHYAELVQAVRRGDILLFHGWYENPNNEKIRAIYREADGASAASSRPP